MMHPDTELRYINETIGYGVFATKFIPKGTFVWVLDELDTIIDSEIVNKLPEILKKM